MFLSECLAITLERHREVRLTLRTLNDQVYLITAAKGTFERIAQGAMKLRCVGEVSLPSTSALELIQVRETL